MEIQCKQGVISDESIDVNIVCMLQWFGPFSSRDDCKQWIKETNAAEKEFNFYIVWGKQYGQGIRHLSLYCGITERNNICERFVPSHIINNVKVSEIWLARFSENKLRECISKQKQQKRQYIECVEHGLINYFSQLEQIKGIDFVMTNERKRKNQPKQSLCIINQWYNRCQAVNRINRRHTVPKKLPDVIYYDANESTGLWKESKRLTLLKK